MHQGAVADSIEAMSGDRPYRPPLGRDEVVGELRAGRGTQWDPELVDAALELIAAGRLRFRHQSGRAFEVRADEPLDAMSDEGLLERLDSEIQRTGMDRSVLRGVDAKQDPEGYTSSWDEPGLT